MSSDIWNLTPRVFPAGIIANLALCITVR